MRIVPQLAWKLAGDEGRPLDPRLVALLEGVATGHSLTAAVSACRISYRAAWGLLREYQQVFATSLVTLERGRGAALTPAGRHVVDMNRAAAQRLKRILPALEFEIGSASEPGAHPAYIELTMAASHDVALAALANTLPALAALDLDVSFMGSLPALAEFAEGRVTLAGFHLPVTRAGVAELKPFMRYLRIRRDRLIRVVDREQGLILPRDNPAGVKRFRDIAALGLRFINRQRGSGTRLLIDRLIAGEKLKPSDLRGYAREEFTHPAVAATVASGGADAGFGLRAAAAEFRLAFVPLLWERYFVAVRVRDLATPAVVRFLAALRSRSFGDLARRLPGYRSAKAGSVTGIDALTDNT